ncbi:hypothetical protein D3C87_1853810 [compost metagenome]
MAVTPVRTSTPSVSVTWPTFTPVTSVIAFNEPVGSTPILIPNSRGRFWAVRLSGSKRISESRGFIGMV